MSTAAILEVRDLAVEFGGADGVVQAVRGVSFDVAAGECLAIVGESGSGKTQTLLACLGLLTANGRASGSVRFEGRDLLGGGKTLDEARGTGIALLSQDPMNALTPHLKIGAQLAELLLDRGLATREEARSRALQALRDVEIPEPEARLAQYPHELSGGMRQRVALAMALIAGPRVLFADEPTTALDVSVQARILELLGAARDRGIGVVLITHDLGVVAGLADRVAVMYAGRLVETATTTSLFEQPAHPYTSALLAAVPRLHDALDRPLVGIAGAPPRPGELMAGCAFAPRCPQADARCTTEAPVLRTTTGTAGSTVACHRAHEERVPA